MYIIGLRSPGVDVHGMHSILVGIPLDVLSARLDRDGDGVKINCACLFHEVHDCAIKRETICIERHDVDAAELIACVIDDGIVERVVLRHVEVDRQLGHLRDECVEVEHISIQLAVYLHHQCIDDGRQVLDASVGTHHHVGISSRQADIHHAGAGIKADDNVLEVIRSAGIHIVHRIDSQFQMCILTPVVIAFDSAVQLYLSKVRTCQAER